MIPFLLSLLATLARSLVAVLKVAVAVFLTGSGRRMGRLIETSDVGLLEAVPDRRDCMAMFRLPGTYCGFDAEREGPRLVSNGFKKEPRDESVHATMA